MSSSLNKVFLIGNLGTAPESHKSISGHNTVRFSIATTERWTDESGKKMEKTQWHKVVAFGRVGEACAKYLTKGSKVFVEGKLSTREVALKDRSEKRYVTEVVASNVQFLSRPKTQDNSNISEKDFSDNFDDVNGEDEIPF